MTGDESVVQSVACGRPFGMIDHLQRLDEVDAFITSRCDRLGSRVLAAPDERCRFRRFRQLEGFRFEEICHGKLFFELGLDRWAERTD